MFISLRIHRVLCVQMSRGARRSYWRSASLNVWPILPPLLPSNHCWGFITASLNLNIFFALLQSKDIMSLAECWYLLPYLLLFNFQLLYLPFVFLNIFLAKLQTKVYIEKFAVFKSKGYYFISTSNTSAPHHVGRFHRFQSFPLQF